MRPVNFQDFVCGIMILFYAYSSHAFAKQDSSKVTFEKRVYTTQRLAAQPPQIDGHLIEACWQEGTWARGYRQFMPENGAGPTKETEIKILYDNDNIYCAIRAFDDPALIDRHTGRRDEFEGDILGVCFDSYFDHRTGFEFDLTAAGVKIDLILMNTGWDTNWDPVWDGKVAMEDSAWTAEMRIPLSQLRYGEKEQHVWGLHAWRWINRNIEEDQWNLMPRDNPGHLYSIGELHGISGIGKSRRIELLPYAVSKEHRFLKEAGNPFATGQNFNGAIGLDGKIGLSSDFTMDFTVNPDFGQVEADPSVLNLSAYETFYEEKRPFFLEGRNILNFGFNENLLFYSRRIGHSPSYSPECQEGEYMDMPENTSILGAAKLTGKTKNGLSLGIMQSITSREKAGISASGSERDETVEPLTSYFVTRIQKDINQSNTIVGGMLTATNRRIEEHLAFLPEASYTGGFDFRHHWKEKTYYVDVKTVFSHVSGNAEAIARLQESSARYYQRPDAGYLAYDTTKTYFSGYGGALEIGKRSNGNWRFAESIGWLSPGLELNDLGYLQQADLISQENRLGYMQSRPISIFREFEIYANQNNFFNFGGQHLQSVFSVEGGMHFNNKWVLTARVMRRGDRYDTSLLRGGPGVKIKGFWDYFCSYRTDGTRKLSFNMDYHTHRFDDAVSLVEDFRPGMNFKVTTAFQISSNFDYSINKDLFQYVTQSDFANKKRYILATLDRKTIGVTMRIDFAITPELTIQYYGNPYISIGEYDDFKYITNPKADDYAHLYHSFAADQAFHDESDNMMKIDENRDGSTDYEFDYPDFNFREFRSNLVARWEFKPGSTLYLVWAHGRSQWQSMTNHSIRHNIDELFNIYPDNIFLLKLSYWLPV